jgi:hypothetical protein
MITKVSIVVAAIVGLVSACATTFTGDAHYPGGAAACHADCQKQNMQMSAFVYSGEFSSSCVCRPMGAVGAAEDDGAVDTSAAAAAVEVTNRARKSSNNQ